MEMGHFFFDCSDEKICGGGEKVLNKNKKCNMLIRDLRVEEEKEINQVTNILQYF